MARGALKRSAADVAVAVSGVAGPDGGTPEKPVGTVWLCWATRGGRAITLRARKFRFRGDRETVRRRSVAVALQGLLGVR
jgi:nicotinamide-nucleotide amidase